MLPSAPPPCTDGLAAAIFGLKRPCEVPPLPASFFEVCIRVLWRYADSRREGSRQRGLCDRCQPRSRGQRGDRPGSVRGLRRSPPGPRAAVPRERAPAQRRVARRLEGVGRGALRRKARASPSGRGEEAPRGHQEVYAPCQALGCRGRLQSHAAVSHSFPISLYPPFFPGSPPSPSPPCIPPLSPCSLAVSLVPLLPFHPPPRFASRLLIRAPPFLLSSPSRPCSPLFQLVFPPSSSTAHRFPGARFVLLGQSDC